MENCFYTGFLSNNVVIIFFALSGLVIKIVFLIKSKKYF
ncbi:protein of unknown function [Oenococcus oeni]|nr:hypothetical protein OENI_250001 [Oenococcus oeni]SYW03097.1 hypothetical protein OENI_60028 [Oenococcus oeni]SYW18681.1 hypothetical protein OENI_50028 [Oenococcus oeni]VDC14349.1 protein of unknown function [Oenococcus oeni]